MNEIITPSIIAALTSLIISIITLFQFFRSQKLQQKQFDKNLSRGLTSKLYDLRIDCYPKAFEITDSIHKLKGGNYDPKIIQTALIDWKKGIVSLVISVEALESFIALRDVLMRNPEKKDTYSSTQIENISHRTKEFRKQLRRDIGFLFREEKERRSKN